MMVLRSLIFSAIMITVTIVVISTATLLFPFPVKVRSTYLKLFSILNLAALKYICGISYEVEGVENIPEGPAIILSKHQSTWETMALQLIFPLQTFVAKQELLWIPFFGWGLAMMKPICINRGSGKKAMQQVIDQGTARLRDDKLWVVIFPEGTRVPPHQKQRYKIGGAMLAAESGYPVVPVAHNAGIYWPKGAFIKRPGVIKMKIGKVIDSKGRSTTEILEEVEQVIESNMQEIYRTTPDHLLH